MTHDIVGKWRVTVDKWVWEYVFEPNFVVRWRDSGNGMSGIGKWLPNQKTVSVSWAPKSATREEWYLPIDPSFQTAEYRASYGKFTLVAERQSRGVGAADDSAPNFVKPPWASSTRGSKVTDGGILWRQELELGGSSSVGLMGWEGLTLGLNNPAIATVSSFVDKARNMLGIDVVGTNPGNANLEARRGTDVVAYMQINVSNVPAANAVYVDNFVTAYYDVDYKHKGGNYSNYIVLHYTDDVVIDVELGAVSGAKMDDATALQAIRSSKIGRGGRSFPAQLNASTTPRILAAKRQAIEIMSQEFLSMMSVSMEAVIFIISMGPIEIGGPMSPRRKAPRSSAPKAVERVLEEDGPKLLPQRGTRQKPTFDWQLAPSDNAGMGHLDYRHAPWSKQQETSKFTAEAWRNLRANVEQTVEEGTLGTLKPDANGSPQAGVVYEKRFPNQVGVDRNGKKALYRIRVVVDPNNHVTTTFPF